MSSVLLLTGATGMVGREVLRRAAADTHYRSILCLVRPGREGDARDGHDDVQDTHDRLGDGLARNRCKGANDRAADQLATDLVPLARMIATASPGGI